MKKNPQLRQQIGLSKYPRKSFPLPQIGHRKRSNARSFIPSFYCPGYTSFMPDNSFDMVSIVDLPKVLNAVQQARKEVQTRFDLKDSRSQIDLNEKDKKLVIQSIDDFKLKAVVEVL